MKKKIQKEIVVVFLSIVILLSFVSCAQSILRIERPHHPHHLAIKDVQGWMTFDYIDFAFNKPPLYLQHKLSLNDPHYPNISIDRYASLHGQSRNILLQKVKDALND